jgi:chorismate mutase / prephenate dehydratase
MTAELELAEAREQIDAVDRGLLAGINRRIELVRRLHEHKVATGLPLRDPGREETMVAALQEANDGPLSPEGVDQLVHFVLELTRREIYGEP